MQEFFSEFWQLFRGALNLEPSAFGRMYLSEDGLAFAILVLFLAGLSQALGQSAVLFINRVRPVRFVLSLIVSSVLYIFSYLFWATSIWVVSNYVYGVDLPFGRVALSLALCYAPQVLGIIVAFPYFGGPLASLLTVWTFLGILTGLEAVQGLTLWSALGCSFLGWIVLQLLQRTVGRPIAKLNKWIRNALAGTRLVTDPKKLQEFIMAEEPDEFKPVVSTWVEETVERVGFLSNRRLYLIVALAAFAGFVSLGILNSQGLLESAMLGFRDTFGLALTLCAITFAALAFAILLTPLESLTWWAGWMNPELLSPGERVREFPKVEAISEPQPFARYVAYLDGIDQGSYEYAPAVEGFLDKLANRLPDDYYVVKGIVPYSVTNRPLSLRRPLAFLWRWLEKLRTVRRFGLLAFVINIRNLFAVLVSADPRYGPIQNQGLAHVLYYSLLHHGYVPGSGVPITLIGSSGGTQMAAGALPYLKNTLQAPIELVSISGVVGGFTGPMEAEHFYHLVGSKDWVARLGIILSPARWPVSLLSNWNRAWRRGKISVCELGKVAHNGPEGPYSHKAKLPDGRTHLDQTLDLVAGIVTHDWYLAGMDPTGPGKPSNYDLFLSQPLNRIENFPADQALSSDRYRPVALWSGRLILPEEPLPGGAVYMEIYSAPHEYDLVGKRVRLAWMEHAEVQHYVKLVSFDIDFPSYVRVGRKNGMVFPERLNGRKNVGPLESIAGVHSRDDVMVRLPLPVLMEPAEGEDDMPTLRISADPVNITGPFCALARFLKAEEEEHVLIQHYNPATKKFDGAKEQVRMPRTVPDGRGVLPMSNASLLDSPLNEQGWYLYGVSNTLGEFVIQSVAPSKIFEPEADEVIRGKGPSLHYINFDYWKDVVAQKGKVDRTLLLGANSNEALIETTESNGSSPHPWLAEEEEDIWEEGDRAIVLHTFGGIGGEKREFSPLGLFFGHFSFGFAEVVRDAFTDELRFAIEYRQVYTNNPTGSLSGSVDWSRYAGDRQYGWLGTRPMADILVKFKPLTEDYDFDGTRYSPLNRLIRELDVMCARYRVGDGTGVTYRNIVNSCVQDSSQALYIALQRMIAEFELNPLMMRWLREHPDDEQTKRFRTLSDLVQSLRNNLEPFGFVRKDWKSGDLSLGKFAEETPILTLTRALVSYRSVLPRLANDVIAMVLIQLGARLWVIRTTQIGAVDEIEPIAPTDLGFLVPKVKRKTLDLGGKH